MDVLLFNNPGTSRGCCFVGVWYNKRRGNRMEFAMPKAFIILGLIIGGLLVLRLAYSLLAAVAEGVRMRRAVKRLEYTYRWRDLGRVGPGAWGGRPKHPVCQQVLRVARGSEGFVFRYCAVCGIAIDTGPDGRPASNVTPLTKHPSYRPKPVPTPPTAA